MRMIGAYIGVLFIFLYVLQPEVRAISALPFPQKIKQPDGTSLTIRLHGDEWFHWITTDDGYRIVRNQRGIFEYAGLLKSGVAVPSGVRVSQKKERSAEEYDYINRVGKNLGVSSAIILQKKLLKKPSSGLKSTSSTAAVLFPPSGIRKNLLILANFSDTETTYSQADFNGLMNQENYNGTGSFRDFYIENSGGLLDITTTVSLWITLPNTHDYYGPESKWGEFAYDAIQAAFAVGVDFSEFDNNADGEVDGVAIIHQGGGQEVTSNTSDIWSHSWTLSSAGYSSQERTFNNVVVNSYTVQPEQYGSSGNRTTIGVICHEFGHSLGVPDYYDVDYASNGSYKGTGNWDLMGSGAYNGNPSGSQPAHVNAYEKNVLGWNTTLTLSSPQSVVLEPSLTAGQVLRINTATEGEFFLLENKQLSGFDQYLPGKGLLIYHVDENYINAHRSSNTINIGAHQGLYPKAAGGIINSASCTFPGTSGLNVFTDESVPNALDWAGNTTNQSVTGILEGGSDIQFDFMALQDGAPKSLDLNPVSYDQITINWVPSDESFPVILAYSTSGDFGTPVNGMIYQPDDVIPGGGFVIYVGDVHNEFQHLNLDEKTTYYYRLWSNRGADYSVGIGKNTLTIAAPVSVFPWHDGFELGLQNWTQSQVAGEPLDWVLSNGGTDGSGKIPVSAYEGGNNVLFSDTDYGKTTRLISPEFIPVMGETYRFSFQHAQADWLGDQDVLKVLTKEEGDLLWTELVTYTTSITNWQEASFYLTPTSNYQIAFEGVANYGHGIVIDEVVIEKVVFYTVTINVTDGINPISGATVLFNGLQIQSDAGGDAVFFDVPVGSAYAYSVDLTGYNTVEGQVDVNKDLQVDVVLSVSTAIEEKTIEKVQVYPNPSNGMVTIILGLVNVPAQYQVVSISGTRMLSGVLEMASSQIDLTALPEGIYILQLMSGHQEHLMKLVIQK